MTLGLDIKPDDPATLLCSSESARRPASNVSISACFEEIADRFPEKTAVKTEQETLTYRELNAQANRVAHTLLTNHGSAPSRIALLFDQGAGALTALLGALKSGHAFIPLDPADPVARIQAIVRDCQPAVLITDEQHAALASQLCRNDIQVLNLNHLPADASDLNPEVSVDSNSLAYIFYTSGSTGQPKGVCQLHRNLLHYIACYSGTLNITDRDRLSLLYSLSFSASNMDVFGALLHGATLCPYDIRKRGMAELPDWLEKEAITVLHAVPTVFRHLLQNVKSNRLFANIRAVDLGGEAVYPSDVELHRNHFAKGCLLVNHLAATEISVIAQYPVDQNTTFHSDMLPVGRAAAETTIRILREDGTEALVSEPGEMVIHSPFLSPGYWQRPDLSATTFAEDPERPGWRIYYSGDLGYFDTNGELYFLGRRDFRVKIRGHSVDTSEVEAILRETSWIRNVAVIARENGSGDNSRRLVAFLEASQNQRNQLPDLRRSLQTRLPSYTIPSGFVFLDSLPLMTSGKIDRKALAQLKLDTEETMESQPDADKPDELEQTVTEWFQKILQRRTVRRSDDFFLLGGDSLKATQLHLHLQDSLGLHIPLEQLFRNPTVGGIADLLRSLEHSSIPEKTESPGVLVALREIGCRPKLFLTHGNIGQAFVSPHFLKIIGEDQPVYAYQATGLDRSRMPRNTIEEMAAEYVRAMRKIQPSGPYFLGSLCVGIVVVVEMARQLVEAGEDVGPLLLIDPPVTPPGHYDWFSRFRRKLRAGFKQLVLPSARDAKLSHRLRRTKDQGRIALDLENPRSLREAAHAAHDFKMALLKHRVKPYQGSALILRSRGRRSALKKLNYPLMGNVQVWEVEGKHNQLHDVNNADFARQLQQCMKAAWNAFDAL